jgi:hypothetical protein
MKTLLVCQGTGLMKIFKGRGGHYKSVVTVLLIQQKKMSKK